MFGWQLLLKAQKWKEGRLIILAVNNMHDWADNAVRDNLENHGNQKEVLEYGKIQDTEPSRNFKR